MNKFSLYVLTLVATFFALTGCATADSNNPASRAIMDSIVKAPEGPLVVINTATWLGTNNCDVYVRDANSAVHYWDVVGLPAICRLAPGQDIRTGQYTGTSPVKD